MSSDSLSHLSLLLTAAFLAGALNAVAGGGSFLTFPALVFAGLPPVAANATGTVALLPGYVSAALGFREDIRALPGLSLAGLVSISLLGGATGAGLLLLTPNDTFAAIVPWLLLVATAAFAFGPTFLALRRHRAAAGLLVTTGSVLAVAVYGGYFNGGLGIMLLALFGLLGMADLNAANGLKNLVSAILTTIAVAVYAWGGAVFWGEALVMMLSATADGYLGARGARRMPACYLRYGIIAIGLVMAAIFFGRLP
jgi:uncharacterized membrane protein YfcA